MINDYIGYKFDFVLMQCCLRVQSVIVLILEKTRFLL